MSKSCERCKEPLTVNFYGTGCCSFDCYDAMRNKREEDLLWAIRSYRGSLNTAADAMAPYIGLSAMREQTKRTANGPLDIIGLMKVPT